MQFIKKVSDYLTTWTPHPDADHLPQHSNPPSPSSDATSDHCRRTEASSVRNAILPAAPGSRSPFTPAEAFAELPPTSHNYDKISRLSHEHPSLRQQLRQAIPRPRLGMPRLPRGGNSMRSVKSPPLDEQRLFQNSRERPDPNGVPIVVGQAGNKKKQNQIPTGFKPVDRISSNARDSGPVRARGKHPRPGNNQAASALRSRRPETVTPSPERTSKRRRVEDPEPTPTKKRNSNDGTLKRTTGASSVAGYPNCMSPSLSQTLGGTKKQDTYWDIEEFMNPSPRGHSFSSEEGDIFFTQAAARARRTSIISSTNLNSARRAEPAQTSSFSVEIPTRNPAKDTDIEDRRPPTIGNGRRSESRESPDELQGEATVRPVPKTLLRDGKKAPGSRAEQDAASHSQPTVSMPSSREGRATAKNKKVKSDKKTFQTVFFHAGSLMQQPHSGGSDELVVDTTNNLIEFVGGRSDLPPLFSAPLRKVRKVVVGNDDSRKIRLELSKAEGEATKVDFELSPPSESKEVFCDMMLGRKIEVLQKSSNWMDRAFKSNQRDQKHPGPSVNGLKRLLLDTTADETDYIELERPKRMRLSDNLQDRTDNKTSSKSPPSETSHSAAKRERSLDHYLKPRRDEGISIPVKKYNPVSSYVRATRSMARRATSPVVCDDDGEENQTPEPRKEISFPKWHKPLVYPRFGKKKAEVDAQDRERLRDNEFLNDNLIGFYMRFLEDHLERCNKEVANRVYFFNSYFFATLTNLPRGKRGINYAGVQKWTRNVDIFSYDYLVVPINENAHWYVAIICNLPHLQGISNPPAEEEEGEEPAAVEPPSEIHESREVPETPEPELEPAPAGPGEENEDITFHHNPNPEPNKEEMARRSLASMSLFDTHAQTRATKAATPSDEECPEREESPDIFCVKPSDSTRKPQSDSQKTSGSTGSRQKARKGKKRPAGIQFDVSQPIIISFDSLDLARSPTITTLRDYLYEEAKSKRGIEITKSLVKGMKAKDIPLQPNYSDCGLYLLAYVEKFIQDPDSFIRKLLKREMSSEKDWPPLRSGLLRKRLRKFLEDLHTEQEQLSPEKASQKTMVDQQPICYLLGSSEEAASSQPSQSPDLARTEPKPSKSPKPATRPAGSPSTRGAKRGESLSKAESQPPVIDIDDLNRAQPKAQTTDSAKRVPGTEVIEVLDSQEQRIIPSSPKTPKRKPVPNADKPSEECKPTRDIKITADWNPSKQTRKSTPKQARAFSVEDSDGAEEIAPPHKTEDLERHEKVENRIQVPRTPSRSP